MCITPEQAYAAIRVLYPDVDYIRRPLNDIYKDIIVQMCGGASRTIHAPLDVAWDGVKRYPPEPVKWREARLSDINMGQPVRCRVCAAGDDMWLEGWLRGVDTNGPGLKPSWIVSRGRPESGLIHRYPICQVIDK